MATKVQRKDDSFIILGSSPGTSLDVKFGDAGGDVPVDKSHIEDALKHLSLEASVAFKAQFQLGDCASPASMMVASTIVTDDATTEDLQTRFAQILDANLILKESLKQNNESIKEQFAMIMTFQEDMMKTHQLHKEKFDDTKELIEKLRQENKQIKQELALREAEKASEAGKSGHSSGLEFVMSPDDDTIHKLTAQLALVERQRRGVLVDNEKLTWQKESLERIVDATTKECAELKIKVQHLELQLLNIELKYSTQIKELESQLFMASSVPVSNVSPEEISQRDETIRHLEGKLSNLHSDLKAAQLKIMELENVKLEFSKHKSGVSDTVRMYKEQLQELQKKLEETQTTSNVSPEEIIQRDETIRHLEGKLSNLRSDLKAAQLKTIELENVKLEFSKHKSGVSDTVQLYKEQLLELYQRLKETQTIVFQPVGVSIGVEGESLPSSGYGSFVNNVNLYDRTLKHLAELLNAVTLGLSDSLMEALGVTASLQEMRPEKSATAPVRACLQDLRNHLEKQHSQSLNHIVQVRSAMSIFEGIFKDYSELLKKSLAKSDIKPPSQNVEALTSALLARGQEIESLQKEIRALREEKDDRDLLKAQLDQFQSDFEVERDSKQQMAVEKESMSAIAHILQERLSELSGQLDEVHASVYTAAASQALMAGSSNQTLPGPASSNRASDDTRPSSNGAIKKEVYTCPKCMKFESNICEDIEKHLDFCLDDQEDLCSTDENTIETH